MFGFGKKRPNDSMTLTQPVPNGWAMVDLGLLGTGGMSQVYRMRDDSLGREVALKVLRPEIQKEATAVQRFIEEARITAQLDHPNIPPVYALSMDHQRATCFSMKLLAGSSLHEMLEQNEKEGIDGLFAALDVLVRVCDALSFAHSRGVLHLDLKPSNIMVGEFGQIYLVDWGLAHRKSSLPTEQTNDGMSHGTPAYMAPEQARGLNHLLDERTDIFALGGILYRILTGRPPYLEKTADLTCAMAVQGGVVPPEKRVRREGRSMPRRLVSLAMRALAKEADQRFATVAEFKRELEDFIRGTAQLPRLVFQPGEAIVKEGEVGDSAYVILEGHCQANRVVAGKTQMLRLLGPGEMFGETAVLTGAPRSATVVALMETTVAVVDQLFLQEEMERTSFMALAVRTLASSFLDLNGQTASLLNEQRRGRAVELALRDLALWGVNGPQGTRRTPWPPLLQKLTHETGLSAEDITQRITRQPGFEIAGDQLVLSHDRP
jgi:CRP-like cAMP-binding protein/tRNA A-37 threonylcarbamoyl transferase component Bud32